MPSVQVNNKKTFFEKIGNKGDILFLLHGWANSWESWMPVVPHLADSFTLIVPDLPGFGSSEGEVYGWSTEEYVDWFDVFSQEICLKYGKTSYMIAGHSYGGKIAAVFASKQSSPHLNRDADGKQHVSKLSGLVLIDASGIPGKLTQGQSILKSLSAHIPPIVKRALPAAVKEKLYTSFGAETDYLHANPSQQKTLQKILPEDIRLSLSTIHVPTLIIWGSQEKFPPLSHGKDFHRLIQNSELMVLDSDHFPHHAFPLEVSNRMTEFLLSYAKK